MRICDRINFNSRNEKMGTTEINYVNFNSKLIPGGSTKNLFLLSLTLQIRNSRTGHKGKFLRV
jgi:hypothetical protein